MRLSTRLLLPLLPAVVAVMTAYAAWSLRQRETTMSAQDRREARAYATALGLALEAAFRDPERRDVQETIDRISREPSIYGVVVYSPQGEPLFTSGPLEGASGSELDLIREALAEADTTSLTRVATGGEAVFSVVRPLLGASGEVVGGFEVLQPRSFLEAEKRRTRIRFLLNTLTLLAALSALVLLLVRRFVGRPLERLLDGVRALEAGDLSYRVVPDPAGGELAELAAEFNRMADRLESARAELVREAEDRLALELRLRDTEKLAAVGNLAAGVAHEIAAPLHVIQGRAELLLRRESPREAEIRNLTIITDQIRRITAIVRNLLDFARRREPRVHPLDLVATVDGVVEFLEGEFIREGITVVRSGPDSLPLEGDGELLFQVFVNLLLNAVHALEDHPGERRVEIRIQDLGQEVAVDVEDTGPGIPPELRERVLEPFFTTKTGGDGTGLGLPIVRSIISEHGGSVEVTSGSTGGACIRLRLPVSSRPSAPSLSLPGGGAAGEAESEGAAESDPAHASASGVTG